MMLEEANARLKKMKITEEQLWGINSLYILLDLDKDDFCEIVDKRHSKQSRGCEARSMDASCALGSLTR